MVKLSPTRGIIGGKKRRFIYKESSKEDYQPKSSVVINPEKLVPPSNGTVVQLPQQDIEGLLSKLLQSFKGEMGELIQSTIKKYLPQGIDGMLQSLKSITVQKENLSPIQIDESVADVGIGKQPELEKGQGVSQISKEETLADTKLSSAKSKLQSLKSKKPSVKKKKD